MRASATGGHQMNGADHYREAEEIINQVLTDEYDTDKRGQTK